MMSEKWDCHVTRALHGEKGINNIWRAGVKRKGQFSQGEGHE